MSNDFAKVLCKNIMEASSMEPGDGDWYYFLLRNAVLLGTPISCHLAHWCMSQMLLL